MQKFKSDQSFVAWLRKHPVSFGIFITLLVLGVSGAAITIAVGVATGDLARVLFAPVPLLLPAFALIGLWVNRWSSQTVAVVDGDFVYCPATFFEGTLFPSRVEGYVLPQKGTTIFVGSSVENIRAVWRPGPQEIERIELLPDVTHEAVWVTVGPVRVDAMHMKQGLSILSRINNPAEFRTRVEGALLTRFEKRLVHDPHKAVGIRFKKLSIAVYGPLANMMAGLTDMYPTFIDLKLYVSVENPDELIAALQGAMAA